MAIKAPRFVVIKDTREQKGYTFNENAKANCGGMVVETLKTGDYTLQGMENLVCIERKASVEELALNLGQKKKPFMAEMDRMMNFPHRYLICEFDLEDVMEFPNHPGSRIPEEKRKSTNVTSQYLAKCLGEIQVYNDIHVVFCGNKYKAFLMVMNILKRVNELHCGD